MSGFAKRPKFEYSPAFGYGIASFLLFFAVGLFTSQGVFVVPALISWLVAFISDRHSSATFRSAIERFREDNMSSHPDIFSETPPQNLDSINGDFVDLYDLETGLYIGRGLKRDIQTLFDAFDNDPHVFENGPNDIPLTQDFIEQVQESVDFEMTPHFMDLMNNAMDNDVLTLVTIRWVEPANRGITNG